MIHEHSLTLLTCGAAFLMLAAIAGPRLVGLLVHGTAVLLGRGETITSVTAASPMEVVVRATPAGHWVEERRTLGAAVVVVAPGGPAGASVSAVTVLDDHWECRRHPDGRTGSLSVSLRPGMLLFRRAGSPALGVSPKILQSMRKKLILIGVIFTTAVGLSVALALAAIPDRAALCACLLVLLSTRLLGARAWYEGRRIALASRTFEAHGEGGASR